MESFKKDLRSCLIAEKLGIPIGRLDKEYYDLTQEHIEYDRNLYPTLKDFLQSIPDTCKVVERQYDCLIFPVITDKQAAISELVLGQKDNKYQAARKQRRFGFSFPSRGRGFSNHFTRKPFNQSTHVRPPSFIHNRSVSFAFDHKFDHIIHESSDRNRHSRRSISPPTRRRFSPQFDNDRPTERRRRRLSSSSRDIPKEAKKPNSYSPSNRSRKENRRRSRFDNSSNNHVGNESRRRSRRDSSSSNVREESRRRSKLDNHSSSNVREESRRRSKLDNNSSGDVREESRRRSKLNNSTGDVREESNRRSSKMNDSFDSRNLDKPKVLSTPVFDVRKIDGPSNDVKIFFNDKAPSQRNDNPSNNNSTNEVLQTNQELISSNEERGRKRSLSVEILSSPSDDRKTSPIRKRRRDNSSGRHRDSSDIKDSRRSRSTSKKRSRSTSRRRKHHSSQRRRSASRSSRRDSQINERNINRSRRERSPIIFSNGDLEAISPTPIDEPSISSTDKSTVRRSKPTDEMKDKLKNYLTKDSPMLKAPASLNIQSISNSDPRRRAKLLFENKANQSNTTTTAEPSFSTSKQLAVETDKSKNLTEKMLSSSFDIRSSIPVKVFNNQKKIDVRSEQQSDKPELVSSPQHLEQSNNNTSSFTESRSDSFDFDNDCDTDGADGSNFGIDARLVKRIRDYSPDYRKKENETSRHRKNSISVTSVDSTDIEDNYESFNRSQTAKRSSVPFIFEHNDRKIPLITNESLRSYTKRSQKSVIESDSVSEDGIVFKESDYENNEEDENKDNKENDSSISNDCHTELEILKPTRTQKIEISAFSIKLTRQLIGKIMSALPKSNCESMLDAKHCLYLTNKNLPNQTKFDIIESAKYIIDDDFDGFDNSINYTILLNKFIEENNLDKPHYEPGVCVGEDVSNLSSYFCGILIGEKKWCAILKTNKLTPEDVKNRVSKVALEDLQKSLIQRNDSCDQEKKIEETLHKIKKLFKTNNEKLHSSFLEKRYNEVYQQQLMPNWLNFVQSSEKFSVKEQIINEISYPTIQLSS